MNVHFITVGFYQNILPPPIWTVAVVFAFSFIVLWNVGISPKKRHHPPPGPEPHPFVGHLLQVPTLKPWRYFEDLGKKHGPIVRLSLAGDELVILNDPEDAEELLGRRSHNYSSRKPLIYAGKYQSRNKRILFLPYGEELKMQRAAFYQILRPRVVGSYEGMQELESTKFLYNMLVRPQEAHLNSQRYAASLAFALAYGRRIEDDDKDLHAVLSILEGFVADCYPGAHLVDAFPILDKLPDFLAPWRAAANRKHETEMKLYSRLVLEIKQKMDAGDKTVEGFAARLWEVQDMLKLDLETISYMAGTTFEAGTDTTASTMLWFLLAMILHPQAQKRAQAELDALLGADGEVMPGFAHIDDLPYCVALTKEVFRWMPAAPGGFPHYSDNDDEYKGYTIARHTMVIPNTWAMQHNARAFPDPLVFRPERFLRTGTHTEHDSMTEGHYVFGFGRRACPGKYLATKTIWIGVTRTLWAFDIGPAVDIAGRPVPVDLEACTSGITSKPYPFAMTVKPRSAKHAETICRE